MNDLSLNIRRCFLNFFKDKGCIVIPSDSLIPTKDETLLFTSAGMVQFKQHFLGQNKDLFTRVTSCQKCFRTSDIDKIGFTIRHLTFFEMLGNFSFGDYFKEEAICWTWKFLTQEMLLPIDRLYVTVHKDDNEAISLWQKVISSSKIIKMGDETNFWHMGDTGPCGPCSEILIDLGIEMGCGKVMCGPGCECDRYLEISNLVFTQFDKQSDGTLKNLPRKNIDTGMGLERLVLAVNGKKNVFDTDLFVPIIKNIEEILKIRNEKSNISKFRVIADHSRAAVFLILDGVLPSNIGRGYVLRRILRRALRQGRLCGYKKPFINKLVPMIIEIMMPVYPDLLSKLNSIQSIIEVEEKKFLETLDSGSVMLSNIINFYKSRDLSVISGKDVFKLYDTYGFPHSLTREIAHKNGMTINETEFKIEQETTQEKSRSSWVESKEKDATFYSVLYKKVADTMFVGYDNYVSKSQVLILIKDDKEVNELIVGDEGEVILSQSIFYAQSGGQSSDRGKIVIENIFESSVESVFKPVGNLFVHKVKVLKGTIKVNDEVSMIIDVEYRKQIAQHHTTTHLLHKVLRETFGTHIAQAGSLISYNCLRFDFVSFFAIKKEDLIKIENKINMLIRANSEVIVKTMEITQARKLGAIALFGEKYKDFVRTISIKNSDDNGIYSMELCGGTHVKRTGDIGIFKIISESSVASGIRRIEGVTGKIAEDCILKEEFIIEKISQILSVPKKDITNKIQKYITDYNKLKDDLNLLKNNLLLSDIDSYAKKIKTVNGINFLSILVKNTDIKILRYISSQLKLKLKSVVLLISSENENKSCFVVYVTSDYIEKGINANKIAKAFAADINGSGGGKFDFAEGGSKDLSNLSYAVENLQKYIII
ncbi:MAG: alanine--tRNA ligase [Endomicrobium sp.]|jgi:alanyl-tRNA synthetase|nr:alanine--tRNA ligase [Endomicrobium sp.]